MIYKDKFRRRWRALQYLALCIALLVGLIILMPTSLPFAAAFLCLTVLATAILHLRYHQVSHGVSVTTRSNGFTVSVSTDIDRFEMQSEDIDSVVLYRSRSIDPGSVQFSPTDSYWFLQLKNSAGGSCIVTCFVIDSPSDLLRLLGTIPTTRKASAICFPPLARIGYPSA
jgi:hypothetical protein